MLEDFYHVWLSIEVRIILVDGDSSGSKNQQLPFSLGRHRYFQMSCIFFNCTHWFMCFLSFIEKQMEQRKRRERQVLWVIVFPSLSFPQTSDPNEFFPFIHGFAGATGRQKIRQNHLNTLCGSTDCRTRVLDLWF